MRKGQLGYEGLFDKECAKAKREVSVALTLCHDSSASKVKFKEYRRDYKYLVATKKQLHQNAMWAELRASIVDYNNTKFWEPIARVGKGTANVVETHIEPAAWVHHFSTLYRTHVDEPLAPRQRQGALFTTTKEIGILIPEVIRALGALKRNKIPGPDMVPVDLYHEAPYIWAKILTKVFNAALERTAVPQSWPSAIIVLIYKKGNRGCPAIYRLIYLLDGAAKEITGFHSSSASTRRKHCLDISALRPRQRTLVPATVALAVYAKNSCSFLCSSTQRRNSSRLIVQRGKRLHCIVRASNPPALPHCQNQAKHS
ncbi:hypothetical protein NDU88_003407 [Pleurodeles waltl]|uniref:Reverse transcriptase n=1 Tax=Pleurodeles waltl TaxID=8319 RepID=A0AAV7VE34_PLEWA|nr:hypothetical protein NDU88_003407 [Pleurodeles waltl]